MKKNWLEWVVFAIGALLTLSVFAFLGYEGLVQGPGEPVLSVQLGPSRRQGEHYLVPFRVRNRGDRTAEGVNVEVTLQPQDGELQTASLELAFVPRQSYRDGWVTFDFDPERAKSVKARAVGFEKP